jgi:hypothetical protein
MVVGAGSAVIAGVGPSTRTMGDASISSGDEEM